MVSGDVEGWVLLGNTPVSFFLGVRFWAFLLEFKQIAINPVHLIKNTAPPP